MTTVIFDFRNQWGVNPHGWDDGEPSMSWRLLDERHLPGLPSPSAGSVYTVCHYCRASLLLEPGYEDRNGTIIPVLNAKLQIMNNLFWPSNDAVADGFIDIGSLYWLQGIVSPGSPIATHAYDPDTLAHNYTHAKNELNGDVKARCRDAGVDDAVNPISSCFADNGDQNVRPNGYVWPNSDDNQPHTSFYDGGQYGPVSLTPALDLRPYMRDGKFIDDVYLPLYYATRYHDGQDKYISGSTLMQMVKVSFSDDVFKYVPWAALINGNWRSCNDNKTLSTLRSGNWDVVWNNSLNLTVPGDSDGFRVNNNNWQVSPLTP